VLGILVWQEGDEYVGALIALGAVGLASLAWTEPLHAAGVANRPRTRPLAFSEAKGGLAPDGGLAEIAPPRVSFRPPHIR
jgi:hypothetical protein